MLSQRCRCPKCARREAGGTQMLFVPLVGGFCESAFLLCVFVRMYVYVPVWLGFRYLGLLWKVEVRLQPNLGQRCNRVPSYVNEVKGHVPRSRVIWGQVRWKMLVFVIQVSFERLKSDWDQTWFMDIIWEPSYVDEVKVTYRGQRSSEVKLEERLKIKNLLFGCPLKSWSPIETKLGLWI